MTIEQSNFPNTVWDGLSSYTQRTSRDVTICPNYQDWDQATAEIINMQQRGLNLFAPTTQYQFLQATGNGTMAWTSTPILGGNLDVQTYKITTTIVDGNLIIEPNGNGALILLDGGNPRGIGAIDLQRHRSLPGQVASGLYATICGGSDNRAASGYCAITGGGGNTIIDGDGTSTWSAIVGGQSNVITNSPRAGMLGVYNSNMTDAAYCGMVGGRIVNINESHCGSVGGRENELNGRYSAVVGGWGAVTKFFGQKAQGCNFFAVAGDAQTSVLTAYNTTNDAVTNITLFLDGLSQKMTLSDGDTWLFTIQVVARETDQLKRSCGYEAKGIIERTGESTTLVNQSTTNWGPGGTPFGTCVVSANDTDETLRITVTGVAATTIYWVARIVLVQVNG
jgi:hypothetical protein